MKLDVRKSEALLAVIETGSFELAAKQLNLTTSAISQRIRALEEALGVPLVIRGKPCCSTKEGLNLVQYLRREKLLAEEFESDFFGEQNSHLRMTIAINNDTLSSWLFPAISGYIIKENVLIDIIVDDQDFTLKALEEGIAIAAISSVVLPMRGCKAEPLGAIRYKMLCSPLFFRKWFSQGVKRETLLKAPLLVFGRKDKLQSDFLKRHFSMSQEACHCHYIPSTEAFYIAVKMGVGYGMISQLHYQDAVEKGELIDICPGRYTNINLFWHYWHVQSPKLERLTQCLVSEAPRFLISETR
ncbi:HTH-type transcriptional regulator ArgP [Photorhabdus temperata]|uniref:HTH lysR-type domain-containing protein n=1 Tax=Photorhabdus temperata J3 TaxID=1389415 RepID=U7R338_PHOTE|nr:HTH-type transcriptional regulator ArgP [Photorhabdus temperata]EQC00664.1 chromosome replication initiation inhibitor protein [Photorhabdus temperata subsp. temperata M1021]ERT14589.1 hypothetical protein O185_02780 [Photorhabdus temperata J3]